MNIHCLAHVPFEDAANIGVWAGHRGHPVTYTRFFEGDPLPGLDAFDMLAVMGGLMNIYEHDAYPWLIAEKQFLKQAIEAGKKVIGVCLGAQLIADVLGGKVTQNRHKEIGWHTVTLTEAARRNPLFKDMPPVMDVFQWHGDTFALPPEAVLLAENTTCANQAFLYRNNALALQFHMEYSRESIEKMLTHCADELVDAPFIQTPEAIRGGDNKVAPATERLFFILDTFTTL